MSNTPNLSDFESGERVTDPIFRDKLNQIVSYLNNLVFPEPVTQRDNRPESIMVRITGAGSEDGYYEFITQKSDGEGGYEDEDVNPFTHTELGEAKELNLNTGVPIDTIVKLRLSEHTHDEGDVVWEFEYAAAGGSQFAQITDAGSNYLEVRALDSTGEMVGDPFLVAKPPKLRHDVDEYYLLDDLTSHGSNEVEVSTTSPPRTETWQTTPPYRVGDKILISEVAWTGVSIESSAVTFIDLNIDGRAWGVE